MRSFSRKEVFKLSSVAGLGGGKGTTARPHYTLRVEAEWEWGGERRRRHAYRIVAALVGMANRSSMFENGGESNACSALGSTRGGRF